MLASCQIKALIAICRDVVAFQPIATGADDTCRSRLQRPSAFDGDPLLFAGWEKNYPVLYSCDELLRGARDRLRFHPPHAIDALFLDSVYVKTRRNPMPPNLGTDVILRRFRAALEQIYGDRLERVVLYGSRARGDNRPDSDYDIAVFIKEPASIGDELHRLASLTTDILLGTDAVISAIPFRAGAYQERTGFMRELRNDGLDL